MIQQNQQQARQVLMAHPQLTKALFQVRFSMFFTTANQVARYGIGGVNQANSKIILGDFMVFVT